MHAKDRAQHIKPLPPDGLPPLLAPVPLFLNQYKAPLLGAPFLAWPHLLVLTQIPPWGAQCYHLPLLWELILYWGTP